jgi:hypothetical protein
MLRDEIDRPEPFRIRVVRRAGFVAIAVHRWLEWLFSRGLAGMKDQGMRAPSRSLPACSDGPMLAAGDLRTGAVFGFFAIDR